MSRFSVIIQAKVGNVFLPRRPKPMLDPEVMLNKPKVFKQYIFFELPNSSLISYLLIEFIKLTFSERATNI